MVFRRTVEVNGIKTEIELKRTVEEFEGSFDEAVEIWKDGKYFNTVVGNIPFEDWNDSEIKRFALKTNLINL